MGKGRKEQKGRGKPRGTLSREEKQVQQLLIAHYGLEVVTSDIFPTPDGSDHGTGAREVGDQDG